VIRASAAARIALVTLVLLAPRVAAACATCVSSAYGDRTFNWAFLGLLLMPFVVGLAVAGVLAARYYGLHRSFRSSGRAVAAQLAPHEESSL
jgi:hypothetical protein